MTQDHTNDEIVEITVESLLSLPPSVTLVEAIRQAILKQPWAADDPEQARALYEALMQHPEMIDLLHQFPNRVSVEQLIAKIIELLPQLITVSDDLELLDDIEVPDDGEQRLSRGIAYLEAVWEQVVDPLWERTDQENPYSKDDFIEYSQMTVDLDHFVKAQLGIDIRVDPWVQFKGMVRIDLLNPDYGFLPDFVYVALTLDLSKLENDITILFILLSWDDEAEQSLMNDLDTALENLETVHIGEREYPVPVKEHFEKFLEHMQTRQVNLTNLAKEYGLVQEDKKGWIDQARDKTVDILNDIAEWLQPGVEWSLDQLKSGIEGAFDVDFDDPCYGMSMDDCYRYMQFAGARQEFQQELNILIAENVLIPLYNASQLGTQFGDALQSDWKTAISALAGAAFGMTSTLVGVLTGIDLIIFALEFGTKGAELGLSAVLDEEIDIPIDEAIESARTFTQQLGVDAFNAIGLDGEAYRLGVNTGMLGMSVAETVTFSVAPRGGALDDDAALPYPRPKKNDFRLSFDRDKLFDLPLPNGGGLVPTTPYGPLGGARSIPVPNLIPRVQGLGSVRVGVVTQTIPIPRRYLMAAALMTSSGTSGSPPPEDEPEADNNGDSANPKKDPNEIVKAHDLSNYLIDKDIPGLVPQPGSREAGVDRAWRQERELVRQTGKGTRDWTVGEIEELLQNGKVNGYIGDHINGVKSSPEWQGDPRNIQFVPRSTHIDEHGGYWQNPDKFGPLIDREKIISTWED